MSSPNPSVLLNQLRIAIMTAREALERLETQVIATQNLSVDDKLVELPFKLKDIEIDLDVAVFPVMIALLRNEDPAIQRMYLDAANTHESMKDHEKSSLRLVLRDEYRNAAIDVATEFLRGKGTIH